MGTHQGVSALEVLVRKGVPVVVEQLEGPSNEGLSAALVGLGDALAVHALLLELEVVYQTSSREEEESSGFPGERLGNETMLASLRDDPETRGANVPRTYTCSWPVQRSCIPSSAVAEPVSLCVRNWARGEPRRSGRPLSTSSGSGGSSSFGGPVGGSSTWWPHATFSDEFGGAGECAGSSDIGEAGRGRSS